MILLFWQILQDPSTLFRKILFGNSAVNYFTYRIFCEKGKCPELLRVKGFDSRLVMLLKDKQLEGNLMVFLNKRNLMEFLHYFAKKFMKFKKEMRNIL